MKSKQELLAELEASRKRITELEQASKDDSHERFKILIEKNSDGFALVDEKTTVLYVSPSVKSITGYAPEELINT
ncbi:MAG: PAS domain S-box protein, partial [Ignavibacteriae bacterium]|nr:PAS domain S-box protein [Ignavibacteriota bacterium]